MILLAILILCVASVPLAGGRITRLGNIDFQRPWAGLAALILQYTIMRAFPEGDQTLHAVLHLVSYALMFYFLAANLSLPGLWLIGIGGACNALAIAANNGVMPAQSSALATAGIVQVPGEFANSTAVDDPKLWFLGDVFALPAGAPMANVFSVGDVLLLVGAFLLLHRVSNSRLAPYIVRAAAWAQRTGPRLELVREYRPFRRLWIAQGVSSVGDWVYPIAVFSDFINRGAKASSLAFLMLAHVGPAMVMSVLGGPLIDRFSRKWMMFMTDIVRGLAVVTLLLVGTPTVFHLYAVAVVLGVGTALNQPAFQASLPNLVPARHLTSANSIVALTMSLALMIGPLLGAMIVDEFGITWGFTANAISFFFAAALVWGTEMPARVAAQASASLTRELKDGMRYVRSHREILAVVIVVGMITLAAGIKSPLEPLFALESLESGAAGLGLLGATWGVGMFLGAVVASPLDERLGHGPLLTWSVVGVGIPVLAAAFSPGIAPVLVLWLFAGGGNTLGTVAYETLLQEQTPDHVRGRVFAAVEASLQAGLLLGVGGAALSGMIFADEARGGMAVAGVLFLVAALASYFLLQRGRTPGPPAVPFGVRGVNLLQGGPELALLRVSTEGADVAPVLLIDDGERVHRVEALPGLNGGSFGYGVPKRLLLARRMALALELPDRVVDVSWPRAR